MSTPTTTPDHPTTGSTVKRFMALARAETLQFVRNKTLLINAAVVPIAFALVMYFVQSGNDEASKVDAAATAMEYFLLFALMFVQYYTVLSMVTTRRDEGVLKRLRTGESRDVEILSASSFPGAVLTIVFTVVIAVLLMVLGAPGPVNVVPIIVAVLLGLAVVSGLALVTSGFTKNAEAAQITSLPVMVLLFASMGLFRQLYPEAVTEVVDRTPFALIFDLAQYGWAGNTMMDRISADGAAPLSSGEVLAETWQMMLILVVWAVVCLWAGAKYVRWDIRR
ncbi:MAG: ABC transporter permease [Corynebacterium sp.]|uniref:ABC transporter permease n=1 Tax=Corynebacterium TaxID=1716 RepID=UPI002647157F|nr:ABC transporter permease [Corynebacterium sp.]MDN5722774.1 ABC transporter permease [Corynebacterium sp.]MDN6282933.1 ABC transporter permease [Corynebacterium sp.]MDN6305186.1 ABC transporter permease [Corynebacterium sp.]MDN6352847.1 ABC transporter permease [Corynebacterium sp.]MDN6367394.1 ABC transporter permease [Corynebacterium sp.]